MQNKPTCKKCGRPLTDPISIKFGMGPECRDQHHIKQARTSAFRSHQPFVAGFDGHTKQPVTYQPLPNGDWINKDGQVCKSDQLQKWLERYGFIHSSIVANQH